jgi:hypothetical protein
MAEDGGNDPHASPLTRAAFKTVPAPRLVRLPLIIDSE